MKFVDEAKISVKAGKGGSGCIAFRREKFIPKGGPNGGDGGDGGNVIVRANPNLLTLYDFRLKRHYEAKNGEPGCGSQCNGHKGDDLILDLPVGTMLYKYNEDGSQELMADLTEPWGSIVLARGGRGGKGNEHFKTSTMRAPRFAQPGEEGEEFSLRLELKILADAGIIGLPNAGKSTFISRVSAANPKIADYPFTTITPNLGVMINEFDPDQRLVMADIPGLIEGAHTGQGLGDKFLRHVERTRFFIHILSAEDISDTDPWAGFDLINEELRQFDSSLADRRQLFVVNKCDLLSPERLEALQQRAQLDHRDIFFISAKGSLADLDMEKLIAAIWETQKQESLHDPFVTTDEDDDTESMAGFGFNDASGFNNAKHSIDDEFPDIEVIYTHEKS